MSGHSHWAGIKHKKAILDAQRSKVFSKLANEITIAARDGGGDPKTNPKLSAIIEKAKEFNMPKENIERAIQRGTGEGGGAELQELLLEGYGPGGIALLIECITDNKNRTIAEMKQILSEHGGKLTEGGGVRWLFERKGVLLASAPPGTDKQNMELVSIEAGAQDISWDREELTIFTDPAEFEGVRRNLEEKGIPAKGRLEWVAKEEIEIPLEDREAAEKLFEALDENSSVQEIYSNLKA